MRLGDSVSNYPFKSTPSRDQRRPSEAGLNREVHNSGLKGPAIQVL